jgi:hypothetical protein
LSLGDEIAVKPVPQKEALDFLDAYFDRQRKSSDAARASK